MSIAAKDAAPTAPNKSQTSSRNVSTGKNANYIQNMCISLNQIPIYIHIFKSLFSKTTMSEVIQFLQLHVT